MKLKSKFFLLLGIALMASGLSGCVLPVMLYQRNKMDRKIAAVHGHQYVYTVKPAPAFLTEELAIAKAWVTLAREGFNTNEWSLVRDIHPATAPDGTRDRYFDRFSPPDAPSSPRGRVRFRNAADRREFDVRLEGKRVYCQSLFTGKSSRKPEPPEHKESR
jgi:hypothetical protein